MINLSTDQIKEIERVYAGEQITEQMIPAFWRLKEKEAEDNLAEDLEAEAFSERADRDQEREFATTRGCGNN